MLSAECVNKSYFQDGVENRVLRDASVRVGEGEFVCIVGRSGSGKSTFLNVLSTLLNPDSGRIVFRGRDLTRLGEKDLNNMRRNEFAIVFQHHHLMAYLNAEENVLVPFMGAWKPVSRRQVERAAECLSRVGLEGKRSRLPGQLSGGEQQRVAIARALVKSPSVLFADEPTGNLDRTTGDRIVELLRSLNDEGIAVVMVTHEIAYTAVANKVIEMSDGFVREVAAAEWNARRR